LNYETAQDHTINIDVSDGTTTITVVVVVLVQDVNEGPPVFTPPYR
jgi:hypothetical protein